jgi:hypothetical protein
MILKKEWHIHSYHFSGKGCPKGKAKYEACIVEQISGNRSRILEAIIIMTMLQV